MNAMQKWAANARRYETLMPSVLRSRRGRRYFSNPDWTSAVLVASTIPEVPGCTVASDGIRPFLGAR